MPIGRNAGPGPYRHGMSIFTAVPAAVLTTIEPDAFGPLAVVFLALYLVVDTLAAVGNVVERFLPFLLALPVLAVLFIVRLKRR